MADDIPARNGTLTFIETRLLQTKRQRVTFAIYRCDCGVSGKLPLYQWRNGRTQRCGMCAQKLTSQIGREKTLAMFPGGRMAQRGGGDG